MFLTSLTWLELLGLFGLAAGATVVLYLLSKARKRIRVSTLRFWQAAQTAAERKKRRRIDEPWSLLMQLLALALILLALGQPKLGRRGTEGRDHVLLLDASAWMGARAGPRTLAQEAARSALRWVRSLPEGDRVMVVYAGPLATPATPFESSRAKVEAAIRQLHPGAGAVDLDQAFSLAMQAQRLEARRPGEIVYAGAARVNEARPETIGAPPNLRLLPVPETADNCGLSRVWMRRAPEDPALWRVFVTARNDSTSTRTVPLTLAMGGAVAGTRMLTLEAGSETTATFGVRTRAAGWVEARLGSKDALPGDNRVTLEAPAQQSLRVRVFSTEPDSLKPLFAADPRVEATYAPPDAYSPDADADLLVLDRFAPARPPAKASLWILPPAAASPIRAVAFQTPTELAGWNATHPLGAGLHSRDLRLSSGLLLRPDPDDIAIAVSANGALAAARQRGPKLAVLGFHPVQGPLRYELAMPLLIAHLLEWFGPQVFLDREVLTAAPGAVTAVFDVLPAPESVRVLDESGQELPFTIEGRSVRFFASEPGTVRVLAGSTEKVFALTLPDAGRAKWTPPDGTVRGFSSTVPAAPARDLWPWLAALGAALLLLEWWIFGRVRARVPRERWLAGAIKAAAAICALAAMFEPFWTVNETKMAIGVLADTSSGLTAADLSRASQLAGAIEGASGRHDVRVLPFARTLRTPGAAESATGWKLARTAGEAGRGTNIEAAVREAIAILPSGRVPRLVLISDGRETLGSAARAAYQCRQLGIPVDTLLLEGRPQPRLRLTSVRLPAVAFTGERVPVELIVESPSAASAELEFLAEGKSLGARPAALAEGENAIHAVASVATPGAISLTGVLRAEGLGEARFEQAISLRRPKLLYVTQDPDGMESHLLGALRNAQIEISTAKEAAAATFDDFQLVVFQNYDIESLSPAAKENLERFVQRGGGLLVIGGERLIYMDKKNRPPDALDRTLPALIAPPRSPEGTAITLIVDKSSSMEGRKIELARLAAIGVVENLRPIDQVGVLIFDNSHQWAVPLRRAEDRTMIKRLIAGIMPDGGTQIAPALAEAYRRMLTATGAFKHIVLLTDGISEEGDSLNVAKEAAERRITISTVGLGQDVNRAYLEKIALNAKGKAYFLTDPSGLEQILLRDVMEHTGSTTVEKALQLKVISKAEILRELDLEKAPALKGYVRFIAKKDADLLMTVPGPEQKDDPLMVRWQYGLGRAAVFASDAKTRWAEAWVGWNGFDKFWINVVRDLLPHAQSGETTMTHDAANGVLVAEYRFATRVNAPDKPPALYALGPDGFQRVVEAEKAGEGYYRARIPVGNRQGLFRLRPLAESAAFPETGIYLPESEMNTHGNNPTLLRQIARYTGGTFNPKPSDIFDTGGRSVPGVLRLWPGLLAAAILLNLAEVAWRKLKRT